MTKRELKNQGVCTLKESNKKDLYNLEISDVFNTNLIDHLNQEPENAKCLSTIVPAEDLGNIQRNPGLVLKTRKSLSSGESTRYDSIRPIILEH